MDIEQSWFKSQLSEKVSAYKDLTVPQILNSVQLLPKLTKELLVQEIIQNTHFVEAEQAKVIAELWKGVKGEPPSFLDEGGAWLLSVPDEIREPLKHRLAQLKLNKYINTTYGPHVEPYFLQRRADLERVVYGLIRVDSQGIAEEFYLRLLEEEDEFCVLASEFSLGDEKYTNGLLGPIAITQPPEIIRNVIKKLKVGEVHPPFRADKFFFLLKLVHRISPSLDDTTRNKLMMELFEKDIQQEVGTRVQETVDQSISARQLDVPGEIKDPQLLQSSQDLIIGDDVKPNQDHLINPPVDCSPLTPTQKQHSSGSVLVDSSQSKDSVTSTSSISHTVNSPPSAANIPIQNQDSPSNSEIISGPSHASTTPSPVDSQVDSAPNNQTIPSQSTHNPKPLISNNSIQLDDKDIQPPDRSIDTSPPTSGARIGQANNA